MLKHYAVFIDVLGAEVEAADPAFYAALAAKMAAYARDFVDAFKAGHWRLWNGNNCNPIATRSCFRTVLPPQY